MIIYLSLILPRPLTVKLIRFEDIHVVTVVFQCCRFFLTQLRNNIFMKHDAILRTNFYYTQGNYGINIC